MTLWAHACFIMLFERWRCARARAFDIRIVSAHAYAHWSYCLRGIFVGWVIAHELCCVMVECVCLWVRTTDALMLLFECVCVFGHTFDEVKVSISIAMMRNDDVRVHPLTVAARWRSVDLRREIRLYNAECNGTCWGGRREQQNICIRLGYAIPV